MYANESRNALPPIIMEVNNRVMEDTFSFQNGHLPLIVGKKHVKIQGLRLVGIFTYIYHKTSTIHEGMHIYDT